MKYQISYNATTRVVTVQADGEGPAVGASIIGFFTHDEVSGQSGDDNSDVMYYHIREALATVGMTDMANVRIVSTVSAAVISKPYKMGSLSGVYDQKDQLVGFRARNGEIIKLSDVLASAGDEQDGLLKFKVGTHTFAMVPLNESGSFEANISLRKNTLNNLLSLPGGDGEVSVPSDASGLVIHNGVSGGAKRFYSKFSEDAAGVDSFAVGKNSSTGQFSTNGLALGAYAHSTIIGEITYGHGIGDISRRQFHFGGRTTNGSMAFITATGINGDTSNGATSSRLPPGIYDMEVVVLAREIGTSNYARFVRRATVVYGGNGSMAVMANTTSPEPDANSGLAGLSIMFGAIASAPIYMGVTGLAGKTIQWSAFVDARHMGIVA